MTAVVFLGMGSNLGEREKHLTAGLDLIAKAMPRIKVSSIYETEPWGYTDQPPFLNMVCEVHTDMTPLELLAFCQDLERSAGRKPTFRYGPRVLDIDILSYDDQILDTRELAVPHPHMGERAFVLVPLAEIAPDWLHPVLKKTASQLRDVVPGKDGVRLWRSASSKVPNK